MELKKFTPTVSITPEEVEVIKNFGALVSDICEHCGQSVEYMSNCEKYCPFASTFPKYNNFCGVITGNNDDENAGDTIKTILNTLLLLQDTNKDQKQGE